MKKILTTDTTLCAEPSAVLSFREKLEIAKLLEKMNVDCIDLGPIRNPKTDPLLVSTIAPLLRHSTLCVSVGLDEQELIDATRSINGVPHARLAVCVPISTVGMEYTCHKKPAAVLEAIEQQLRRCREITDDVEFCAVDATRSDFDFLTRALSVAAAAGATHITLCDSDGKMLPDEAGEFTSKVLACLSDRQALTVSVAFPDDMHMAVACSIAAVRAGADGVKICVNGKGCANAYPISEVLRTRGEEYGLTCDFRTTELRRCIQKVEQILGSDASVQSLLATSRIPDGNESITLDKNDDSISVAHAVRKLGYDLSSDDEARVFEAFIRLAEKKTVNERELEAIVASTALQVPPTYRLVSYLTNSGNIVNASAHIKLEKDGKTLEGITIGDGPIDASFQAIEQIVGHHYELDDFQIQSVTEGHEAMGNALVRLRSGGKIYSGNGISTDIIGASIRAYLNALNKIVYEEA